MIASTIFRILFASVFFYGTAALGAQGQTVSAYNTQMSPPFVDDTQGLAKALVDYFNADMKGEYHFVLQNISTENFDTHVLDKPSDFHGVALFASPDFVQNSDRYLWSGLLFKDIDVLVFRTTNVPQRNKADYLAGLRFGASYGGRYPYVDALIDEGKVFREESQDDITNIEKLLAGKIDFTSIRLSTYKALSSMTRYAGKIVSQPSPQSSDFQTRMFFGLQDAAVAARVEITVARMNYDPKWQAVLRKYGIVM